MSTNGLPAETTGTERYRATRLGVTSDVHIVIDTKDGGRIVFRDNSGAGARRRARELNEAAVAEALAAVEVVPE